MSLVALVAPAVAMVAVVAWARSARATGALVGSTAVTWTLAALGEYHFANQPEIFAALLFFYFLLPFVIAPIGGAVAALLLGPPRPLGTAAVGAMLGCIAGMVLFAKATAGAGIDLRHCFVEMAAPAVLATCAAVFVATLAARRV